MRGTWDVVPKRFTDSSKTWYYSIPDAEHIRLEENWTTLKKAISEYWVNHHWLEKQKLRANNGTGKQDIHVRVLAIILFAKWNYFLSYIPIPTLRQCDVQTCFAPRFCDPDKY